MIIRNGFWTMSFFWYRIFVYEMATWCYRIEIDTIANADIVQCVDLVGRALQHRVAYLFCDIAAKLNCRDVLRIELDPTGYTNWSLSEEPLESAVSVGALVDLVREVKEYTSSIAGGKEVLWMNHRVRSYTVYGSTLILNYGRLSFILISL